ncbi:hypothetical protein [Mesorhizobium sp. M0701]|uniref:hypothetical protein n=1 Tax=Mesorhizobium sp. M0701 TaxID=2956989 RepID=UPI00333DBFD3
MDGFFAGIEQLALVRGLKASFVAYPVVNALHIMSIGALLTSAWLIDLRIIGAFRSLPQAAFVALLRRTGFAAFGGALVTAQKGGEEPAGRVAAMLAVLSLVLWTPVLFAGRFIGFLGLNRASALVFPPQGDKLAANAGRSS